MEMCFSLAGVCGGSASGKTTVARNIIEELDVPWVTLLSLDSFYKVLYTTHRTSKAQLLMHHHTPFILALFRITVVC